MSPCQRLHPKHPPSPTLNSHSSVSRFLLYGPALLGTSTSTSTFATLELWRVSFLPEAGLRRSVQVLWFLQSLPGFYYQ